MLRNSNTCARIFSLAILLMFILPGTRLNPSAITVKNDFKGEQKTLYPPDPSGIIQVTHSSSRHTSLKALYPLTNYTIEAVLQTSNQTVNAKTTVNYVNHAPVSLDEVIFHLYPNAFLPEGFITIKSVRYAGLNLSYSISGIDSTILNVSLIIAPGPGSLLPNSNITLELDYQIKIPNRPDRFGWHHTSSPELLVYNMGNWHPIVAVYDERGWHTAPYISNFESFYSEAAAYLVNITTPDNYVVAATGELQTVTIGPSAKTWSWITGPVRDFTWCASPHYQTSSILVNGVNVISYHLAVHQAGGQRALQIANQCLTIFSSLFGEYPWAALHIVETALTGAGMEYPQLVMISEGLYNDTSILSSFEKVVVHEIGHQWVPFAIGTDSYTEPWIDEGFASYTELVFIKHVYGALERQNHRRNKLDSYWFFVKEWGDESINRSMDYWMTHTGYSDIVYDKASLVIDMLRNQLGDTTFYQAWQFIYQQAIHRNLRA
ncbi:MAG: M1 family metallopeptidase, partial [Candidatus Bathyarchaeota archaeon]